MRWNVNQIIGGSILLTLAICCTALTSFAETAAPEGNDRTMELIWSESDGLRHEIFTSSYQSGAWGEAVMITDDNADNLNPSIDVDSKGVKWAVWSAVEGDEVEIRYSVYEDGKWKKATKFPSDLSSNTKPTIIVDDADVPWIAWSGNNGDLDDIYYSRFIDGEWTAEKRINSINEVPDILPSLDTDDNGFPTVIWDSYVDPSYVKFQATWDGKKWSEPVLLSEEDYQEELEEQPEIALPEFITDTRQVFLRVTEKKTQENKP